MNDELPTKGQKNRFVSYCNQIFRFIATRRTTMALHLSHNPAHRINWEWNVLNYTASIENSPDDDRQATNAQLHLTASTYAEDAED